MKKLITYLMLWLTALSADVSFMPAGEIPFTSTDNYYNGHNHSETDYQAKYSSYIDGDSANNSGCVLSILQTQDDAINVPVSSMGWKWILYSSVENQSLPDLPKKAKAVKLKATDGQTLIAPGTCTVVTDASQSKYGTYMQLEVGEGEYTITLENMDCWFCCYNRDVSEKGDKGFTHSSNAKGVKLHQGDIIGRATTNTTILIQKGTSASGKKISLKEFYTGSK